ncbi:UvrD-helicase domain-containing protein [Spirochaetia bacterium 38H-sp]|uniref:DNA 3'-5' helicase n=1 Tax=Rarispira pelagica TaxID=3141764 RepID=A0ABU9UAZ2_9SPIR
MIDYKKELNPEQYQAVTTIQGPVLIIAGAGSGKTRVITYRISYMLDSHIPQKNILALTFTNKAAKEMWERVRQLTGKKLTNLTVSTFHSFGAQILREKIHHLGYRPNFSIYDTQDQTELIKQCAKETNLHPELLNIGLIKNIISGIKTDRIQWTEENEVYQQVFLEYQAHLKAYHAVDFDDLIVLPNKLFSEQPNILEEYRNRYKYIMIDEFQDTSILQYNFIKQLAEKNRNICVVGDDDQSIYSWRGANYQNIMLFEKDFPERVEIKLEQNYRSVQTILEAANHLISHNTNRKDKKLWTGKEDNNKIQLIFVDDEKKEAEFIAEHIRTIVLKERAAYHQIGVLVRTNNLMATLENTLLQNNVPYKLSGGKSFFERKEVKDIIAYLRAILNPDDDISILRIINTPKRGIGRQTIQHIGDIATEQGISIYSAISSIRYAEDSPVSNTIKKTLDEFMAIIEDYNYRLNNTGSIAETIRELIDDINYFEYLLGEYRDNDNIARYKYQNIMLFTDLIERWEKDPDNLNPNLWSYLTKISLSSREDNTEESEKGKVNLMTIHAAKGLEFDHVFLAGVEDGIIPHQRAIEDDPSNIEEERRLFYVAITRAKQKLYLTTCKKRKIMREEKEQTPSPFLEEMPQHLITSEEPSQEMTEEEVDKLFADLKKRFSE